MGVESFNDENGNVHMPVPEEAVRNLMGSGSGFTLVVGAAMDPTPLHRRIANEYREINGLHLEALGSPPSALQFSRLVHISRPVIIKGCSTHPTKWNHEYLMSAMDDRQISVAVTPEGQGADALVEGPDGETYFCEPHVEKMTMGTFLESLSTKSNVPEALYLQSQNGNLYPNDPSEFEPLRPDVPAEISWASEALGRSPEAVNLWIGGPMSVTSVHCDPYENIYTVVRGAKHFTLFPPTEGSCLREKIYKHARYTRNSPTSTLTLTPTGADNVRWSSVADPTLPGSTPHATPLRVTIEAGETLYLPPGWWHHVRQSGDETGICIALNWWYDMEMRGMNWVWLNFLRGEPPEFRSEEETLEE